MSRHAHRCDTRTPEQRFSDEAKRWRLSLRDEESRHAETRAALAEANRTLVIYYLREWLQDPRDFLHLVPIEQLVDPAGRILWGRVDVLVDELLDERPHYAVMDVASRPRGSSALQWMKARS
ncbi:hypothetical protein [Microbacterium sp. NPDC077184]|uniref:hypothetical protein n=1 Tax=Microbacterium sp. NPDC077184 TaxID=3154764 RepID=UPI0034259C77